MSHQNLSEKKIFSYSEAVAFLPEIRQLTEDAYRKVKALSEASSQHSEKEMNDIVTQWAHSLMERGLEVKGLWLVDFDNGSGYYCWRYPEVGLHHYHSYKDGFQGRMPIQ